MQKSSAVQSKSAVIIDMPVISRFAILISFHVTLSGISLDWSTRDKNQIKVLARGKPHFEKIQNTLIKCRICWKMYSITLKSIYKHFKSYILILESYI